ncbi:MAG: deoxyguanosinetriphosphate triphosphohydrolase [Chloroflexi bacterium]|nr:MAG: deoxyguanosinetriphosphate triphosphohydrolase [Chloroflexota bacterium]
MVTTRERLEARETAWLSPAAALSSHATRARPEPPSDLRTEFQRDRDRILHSKAFRRLKYKTQVFLSPSGDHMRTRLTHTLEVTQIARTIARALDLNEDLAEAIGLGHDLGHTPFGHAGERALARKYPGFRHNEQSLRVVTVLERGGGGLNLTSATLDGILHHSKPEKSITGTITGLPATLEGQVVKLSDSIAYINHDLDDALRGGMLVESELPKTALDILGRSHSQRIDTLVRDVVEHNRSIVASAVEPGVALSLSPDVLFAANLLRDFLFERVYAPINALPSTRHAEAVVEQLFERYVEHPDELPGDVPSLSGEPTERHVADIISGMNDRYALATFAHLFRVPGEEL